MQLVRRVPARVTQILLLLIACIVASSAGAPLARAAGFSVKINFQPQSTVIPAGYLRDSGEGYAVRTGANQGGGTLQYGWVVPGSSTPLNITNQTRERGRNLLDQRLDTLIHMQASGAQGVWEIAVANGTYDVTVAVGDAQTSTSNDQHSIRIEGVNVVNWFVAMGNSGTFTRHATIAASVSVSDGKLTIDANGGANTKINYVDLARRDPGDPERPSVTRVTPASGETNIVRNTGVVVNVRVPNGGIDYSTVDANTVRLMRVSDGAPVSFTLNSSGGGDEISLTLIGYLDPNTLYRFDVTDNVKDGAGIAFLPFSSSFTTGTSGGPTGNPGTIAFEQIKGVATGKLFSSLALGPDGKLYAATLTGELVRYTIIGDGTLSGAQSINTIKSAAGGSRAVIGLAFDPDATDNNLILWVSHNGPYVASDAADWTGKVSRLSGANLETIQDYVINLPHSSKDHMVNSLAFKPGTKLLYVAVGSNSAMGAPDDAWGQRPERLLSGSVLQINTRGIANPPLNAKTEGDGDYDPFAPGAPVTLYATGVRNAYDLTWHSNGRLYAPTNGSAAGGNTPSIPASLPASCAKRINGQSYTEPADVAGLTNVQKSQNDWLFRVVKNGYYGHPNPLRCEWIMNGGNPSSGGDNAEVDEYPVGTQPDPNWRRAAFDFGDHKSPNGSIEYRSDIFDGKLKGKLLVVRYSLSDDIIALTPGGSNGDIVGSEEGISGFTGFNNPLDLIENPANGQLYVIEFGPPGQITLLRPLTNAIPQISVTPDRIVTNDVRAGSAGATQIVTIRNSGTAQLSVRSLQLIGPDRDQFQFVSKPSLPVWVAAGSSTQIRVAFDPATAGPRGALLQIGSNATNMPVHELPLRGLGTLGTGGTNEPSLQWILDTYEIPVNVGDDDRTTNLIHSDPAQRTAALLGDEVSLQQFIRADNANPVLIEPLAVFGPTSANPIVRFGWYEAGNAAAKHELFNVSNLPPSNGQRLDPVLNADAMLSFDPGTASFGFYSSWEAFSDRALYSEDALNTFSGAIPHHVRVYQLKDSRGAVVPNAYVLATEETTGDFDFQDVVVVVRNVKTATPSRTAPTADAGPDQVASVATQVVLIGSGSDLDGEVLTYAWQQTSGPAVPLEGSDGMRTFTPSVAGSYEFLLTVTDPTNLSASDSVVVTVTDSPPANQPPIADAGPDRLVKIGTLVQLSGSGTDPEGAALNYVWQQTGGPSVTLAGSNEGQVGQITFQAPSQPTTLVFTLTVVDGAGLTSVADNVEIVVTDNFQLFLPVVRRP